MYFIINIIIPPYALWWSTPSHPTSSVRVMYSVDYPPKLKFAFYLIFLCIKYVVSRVFVPSLQDISMPFHILPRPPLLFVRS